MIPANDPRRLITRLAVAIAAADGHVTSDELVAVTELDLLGLGHLFPLAEEEMLAVVEQPIDLRETCEGLVRLGPQTGAVLLTVLAHIAASDGAVSARERETFATIAEGLDVPAHEATHILDAAVAATHARRAPEAEREPRPCSTPRAAATAGPFPSEHACRMLGIERGASPARVEAAYLAAVERYDPMKMLALGPEFVRLSVRKLAEITDAFRELRAAA